MKYNKKTTQQSKKYPVKMKLP